jgi:hypothetical protein
MDEKELAARFRRLGAPDPEAWVASQIRDGIPQLARFLFLRQAWKYVVSEDDHAWIEAEIDGARTHPDAPFAGVGHALKGLRARGATNEEVTDLVRGTQAELLFHLCRLLDDPGDVEDEARDAAWVLVRVDDEGNALGVVGGLHESVLETDPTGREMRPRDSGSI